MGPGEVLVARAEWGAISRVPLVSETVFCSQKRGLWWVSGDLDSVTVGPGAAHFQSLGFPDSPAHKGAWARWLQRAFSGSSESEDLQLAGGN